MAKRQDMEQQVMQLTAQNSELKAQLSTLQAQMNGLTAQLSEQAAQVKNQNAQLESYRAREQAIIYALTEAKETTDRRLAEAEEQARKIVKDAEAQKYVAQRQAEVIERKAKAEADIIIENAKREAEKTIMDMQEAAKEVETQLHQLNAALRETAQRAYTQAGEFAKSINDLRMESQDERPGGEIKHITAKQPAWQTAAAAQTAFDVSMLDDGPEDAFAMPKQQSNQLDFDAVAPDKYESPQKVIQGIYQLQGRDIPHDAAEYTARQEAQDMSGAMPFMPPVTDTENPTPAGGASPIAPADAGLGSLLDEMIHSQPAAQQQNEPAGLSDLLDEIMGEPPAAHRQPADAQSYASAAAPEQAYYPQQPQAVFAPPQAREERLWTVDEVIGGSAAPTAPGGPFMPEAPAVEGLNSLLDDILGSAQPQQTYAPPRQPQSNVDLDSLLNDILGS